MDRHADLHSAHEALTRALSADSLPLHPGLLTAAGNEHWPAHSFSLLNAYATYVGSTITEPRHSLGKGGMLDRILTCGHNPALLLTRTLVLEHAGFRVRSLNDLDALPGSAEECILLCSSLTEAEQLEAVRLTRLQWPNIRILVVGQDRLLEDRNVLRMSAFAGADVLLEHVQLLLSNTLP